MDFCGRKSGMGRRVGRRFEESAKLMVGRKLACGDVLVLNGESYLAKWDEALD